MLGTCNTHASIHPLLSAACLARYVWLAQHAQRRPLQALAGVRRAVVPRDCSHGPHGCRRRSDGQRQHPRQGAAHARRGWRGVWLTDKALVRMCMARGALRPELRGTLPPTAAILFRCSQSVALSDANGSSLL